jgi:predicted RNase H-like nuclease (RuvC/YqgF family)
MSGRHPFSHAVSVCLAVVLCSCGVSKEKMERVESENYRLYGEKQKLEDENRGIRGAIEVEKAQRQRLEEEVEANRGQIETLRKELQETRETFENYRRDFQLQSRVRAVGEELESLAITSGRVYQGVKIRAVLRDSIVFTHSEGQARLPIKNLGEKWMKRFDVGESEPVCVIDEEVLKEACAAAARL